MTIILLLVLVPIVALFGYLIYSHRIRTQGMVYKPKKLTAKQKKRELMKMGLRPAGDE